MSDKRYTVWNEADGEDESGAVKDALDDAHAAEKYSERYFYDGDYGDDDITGVWPLIFCVRDPETGDVTRYDVVAEAEVVFTAFTPSAEASK